jgi:hypothetical protein
VFVSEKDGLVSVSGAENLPPFVALGIAEDIISKARAAISHTESQQLLKSQTAAAALH